MTEKRIVQIKEGKYKGKTYICGCNKKMEKIGNKLRV